MELTGYEDPDTNKPVAAKPKKPLARRKKPSTKKVLVKSRSTEKVEKKSMKRMVTKKKAVRAVARRYEIQRKRRKIRKSARISRKSFTNTPPRRIEKSRIATSNSKSKIINLVDTPHAKHRKNSQQRTPNWSTKPEFNNVINDVQSKKQSKIRKGKRPRTPTKSTKAEDANMINDAPSTSPSKKRIQWPQRPKKIVKVKNDEKSTKSSKNRSLAEVVVDIGNLGLSGEIVKKKHIVVRKFLNSKQDQMKKIWKAGADNKINEKPSLEAFPKSLEVKEEILTNMEKGRVARMNGKNSPLSREFSGTRTNPEVSNDLLPKPNQQHVNLTTLPAMKTGGQVSRNELPQNPSEGVTTRAKSKTLVDEIKNSSSQEPDQGQLKAKLIAVKSQDVKHSSNRIANELKQRNRKGVLQKTMEKVGGKLVSEKTKNTKKKKQSLRTSNRLRMSPRAKKDLYKHTFPSGLSFNGSSDREPIHSEKLEKLIKRNTPYKKSSTGPKRRRHRKKPKSPYYDKSDTRRPQLLNCSDTDSSSTDEIMERKRRKDLMRDRNRIRPINLGLFDDQMASEQDQHNRRKKPKVEISPMKIDLNVDWNSIGGLHGHIQKLKEMVVLPMLYPNEFEKFKMHPPKGVIFHGPPGTGKTLVARVLAAQCSHGGKKVSFYMRKGADCLSKWVGEAERQLRLLFDEAYKNQPSIIFFDEIDGLAPIRSSRQDQIHSSIVSTLLALMDGLDGRGQIIIIGATNRIDAIDPALRRPGRFDRELCFSLPSRVARKQILKIKTKSWHPPVEERLVDWLAEKSVGYCGADIEALCREAFMNSIRRTFPQIYQSDIKLRIDPNKLVVTEADFQTALSEITPAAQRSQVVYARPLPKLLRPLLQKQLRDVIEIQTGLFPLSCSTKAQRMNLEKAKTKDDDQETFERIHIDPHRPKLLISAPEIGHGQSHLGVSLLHNLEEFPVYSLDLASLYGDVSCRSPEEVVLRMFKEARKNVPSVIYWPHIDRWWKAASAQLQLVIYSLIQDLPEDVTVFIIATSDVLVEQLPETLQLIFNAAVGHYVMEKPTTKAIEEFWLSIIPLCVAEPRRKVLSKEWPKLEVAHAEPTEIALRRADCTPKGVELERQIELDFIRIRSYVRTCCSQLLKHFSGFSEVLDEHRVVSNNLSLVDIRERNNNRKYPSLVAFLGDIDQIVSNVRQSFNPNVMEAREYMNEACHLQDQALALTCQADRELVRRIVGHIAKIKATGEDVEAFRYTTKISSNSRKHKKVKPDRKMKNTQDKSRPTTLTTRNYEQNADFDDKKVEAASSMENDTKKSGDLTSTKLSNLADTPVVAECKLEKSEPPSTCSSNKEKRFVDIDKATLVKILKNAARTAKKNKTPIFELEDIYFRILNHVHYFSSLWNRKRLLELIKQELSRLEKVNMPM